MTSVVVLMACHNRREKTVRCLKSLVTQGGSGVSIRVVLTDDGSTDGSAVAAREAWPGVQVLSGDGSLYWARGMALASSAARDYDFLLWLNDDVVLDPGALERLLDTYQELSSSERDILVVGGVRDPLSGAVTYSGVHRENAWCWTNFTTIVPSRKPLPAETMHGNVVLVPRTVVDRIGHIDGRFSHGMADFDYGLRARSRGCTVWVAPGTVGTCAPNPGCRSWTDPALPVRAQLRLILSPKGLPPTSWLRFTRRHAGPFWPAFWISPYVRFIASAALARTRSGAHAPGRTT